MPLSQLVKATKKISAGEFNTGLANSTNDEFSELASSFNSMSFNLQFESAKSTIFSELDQAVLTTSNIHEALKSTLCSILSVFKANQITISIADPLETNSFDTYTYFNSREQQYDNCEQHAHYLNYNDRPCNTLYSLDIQEFESRFEPIHSYTNSKYVWIKTIECNKQVVGYIFIFGDDKILPDNNMIALHELSERLSIIYTTHQQQSELFRKAHFDDLTKLPNRNFLLNRLQSNWGESKNKRLHLALLFIDLDHFKNINDLSGHAVGNKVLIEVSKRLAKCINRDDDVARLSGDEFCIILNNIQNKKQATDLASKILEEFRRPFTVADMSYFLGASIGIALRPSNCIKPENLIENADLAMFKAKQEGRNQYVIFDKKIEKERNKRLSLERHLHFALELNEISLNFQPKIELSSGKLVSAETLARWNNSELGLVPTNEFIILAEESGIINEIGEWILKKSCYQYLDWVDKNIPIDSIAVNVSARQLASKRFTDIVKSTIRETKIPSQCLELEITESAFIHEEAFLAGELEKLHNLGAKISIDDFGKEYSSLNYLKKIPFDTLKIDREFIMELENDLRDQYIVEVIINIGHNLGKQIVAEGIENVAQRDILQSLQCDYGQGYLFSKPLTDIEFLEFASDFMGTNSNNFSSKSQAN